MQRIGLALSGGGFRGTLYHLGVIRFLRDANILPKITHITTVSGGSILGAHLALNWNKYCGSDSEFDEVAREITDFVRLDVRNRIVRRFPLALLPNAALRLLRLRANRQWTRPGLLEKHYERHLFGSTSLGELPDRPRLHILSTNLSEGSLCSFYQGGLLTQRRQTGRRDRFERVEIGLATVSMAVAASSAFPGFFPPLELSAWDLGAQEGGFQFLALTDGGVFDNLGLRMFRCLEESWIRDIAPLAPDDFLDIETVATTLATADSLPTTTPLGRLSNLLAATEHFVSASDAAADEQRDSTTMVNALWEIIRTKELYRDQVFRDMELVDSSAQSLVDYVNNTKSTLDAGDQLWLNRQIVATALQQAIGKPCLRSRRDGFDAIVLSDAGKPFNVAAAGRAGGLIGTAFRASDILMDRVYQLELESFRNLSGVLSFHLTDLVDPAYDSTALHPEIQRQAAQIRTDLDRFSDLEISVLAQHGYCVARQSCRNQPEIFNTDLPTGPPWDPMRTNGQEEPMTGTPTGSPSDARQAIRTARRLRRSASRSIWSTLFDLRDWPTYVWMPLLLAVFLGLPYALYKSNQRARRNRVVLSAIAEMSPVYRKILGMLETGVETPSQPTSYIDVENLDSLDFRGFEIVSDTRIFDLRRWSESSRSQELPVVHTRVRIRRTEQSQDNGHLRFQTESAEPEIYLMCKSESLSPTLLRMPLPDGRYRWELDLDFSHIPIGDDADVVLKSIATAGFADETGNESRFRFTVFLKTGLVQMWMLMPPGRTYDELQIIGYPIDNPDMVQAIEPENKVDLPLGSIATFQLIDPEFDYRYECRLKWTADAGADE